MLDQILAVLLFLIVINSLKRLMMGVKARLTSWGLFIIVVNSFLFLRLPQATGITLDPVYVWVERFIVYTIVIGLNCLDWLAYANLKEEKEKRSQTK